MALCNEERILCGHLLGSKTLMENGIIFDIAAYMDTDSVTPDGFYVDANGVWDGNASSIENQANPGPGEILDTPAEGMEASGDTWRYRQKDGSVSLTPGSRILMEKWYYFDESSDG